MTPLPHVHPALHIGNDNDANRLLVNQRTVDSAQWQQYPLPGWSIVHTAKSPWHADMVGYHSGAAPAESPERWVTRRDRRLALNMIDAAPTPQHLPTLVTMLDTASAFVTESVDSGLSVLVHCNMGLSRSPATTLWWMHRAVPEQPYDEALAELLKDHPFVRQDSGIMQTVKDLWSTHP